MKRSVACLLTLMFILLALPWHLAAAEVILNNTPAKVYFSPDGGATKAITRHIDQAVREVLVQAYLFTSRPIQTALLKAQKRGVTVEVILDRDDQRERKYVTARALKSGFATVWLDDKHACAHDKIIILDRETVITGSFNFTYAADRKNAENILIITSQDLAGLYTDNFLKHRRHSRKY
ncbi:MAG TPA: phospholipase D family protein [Deltaproteobacteria bacterium]|nr:phospholipase D family protein [Deltaproteobacteria bacterium]